MRWAIRYTELITRQAYVEARTSREALERFEDGELDDDVELDGPGVSVLSVRRLKKKSA